MYAPDRFLHEWATKAMAKRDPLTKEILQLALGNVPEPASSFKVDRIESVACSGYTRERILLQISENLQIPLYVLTPHTDQSSFPGVLALHGHGYGSKELVGLHEDGTEINGDPGIHQRFAIQLVLQGFKVFVPDLLGFGDRRLEQDKEKGYANSCYPLSVALMMAGSTLAGMRTFEARQLIDFMENTADVLSDKIGVVGFSGGALVSSLTSALDSRVYATVLSGFTNTFQHSILATDHCIDNYIPSILQYTDSPDIIGLITPRKLFIEAGNQDLVFPLDGVKVAVEQLRKIYTENGALAQIEVDIFEGGHTIHGGKSLPWLSQALVEKEQ